MERKSLFFTVFLHFALFLPFLSWNFAASELVFEENIGDFVFFVDKYEPEFGDDSAKVVASKKKPLKKGSFQKAIYDSVVLNNIYPKYPFLAKRRGQEGEVLLKVRVSEEGKPSEVVLQRSSGFELLDLAALRAVEKWKFIAARDFGRRVASTLLIPVVFQL